MGLSKYQKRSLDRNIKIIARAEEGASPSTIAREYKVSVAIPHLFLKIISCKDHCVIKNPSRSSCPAGISYCPD
ncbi:MAG: hypothetical protein Q7J55_02280 [bacterium]|nr:hypothetical protein [bacterium]